VSACAVVVGLGSIGRRHARILAELGCDVVAVSRRTSDDHLVYPTIAAALAAHRADVVVIATETSSHAAALTALEQAAFGGTILVEKPALASLTDAAPTQLARAYVAYNLRFHPVVSKLRELLRGQPIRSGHAYVGQYLPEWRPGTDYRASYSASEALGGGALRDLSHDLDLVCWLLGDWRAVAALGGHVSALEITSDDVFGLLLETASCPATTLQVNYLDRHARRRLLVNTDEHTYEADLIRGALTIDKLELALPVERDATYRAMHQAVLAGGGDVLCSFAEGRRIVALIDAARAAAATRTWRS
jgi:predicted dehydrogenase